MLTSICGRSLSYGGCHTPPFWHIDAVEGASTPSPPTGCWTGRWIICGGSAVARMYAVCRRGHFCSELAGHRETLARIVGKCGSTDLSSTISACVAKVPAGVWPRPRRDLPTRGCRPVVLLSKQKLLAEMYTSHRWQAAGLRAHSLSCGAVFLHVDFRQHRHTRYSRHGSSESGWLGS